MCVHWKAASRGNSSPSNGFEAGGSVGIVGIAREADIAGDAIGAVITVSYAELAVFGDVVGKCAKSAGGADTSLLIREFVADADPV